MTKNPARVVAAFGLPLAMAACTLPQAVSDRPVGVQLYTVREAMADDPVETLRRVAALGFDEVEYARTYGGQSAALCRETEALGLNVAAVHAPWDTLRNDPAQVVAEAKSMCADTLMLAWLPQEERATLAQWRWWVDHLNDTVLPLAQAEGMTLAYHAHDFEFAPIDGVRPIDMLMDDLNPQIGFELDTYWLVRTGEDPLAFYRANRDRVTHLHLKDLAPDGAMADVGAGTIDFAALLAAIPQAHLVVEHDDAPDPFASIAASLAHLRAISGGREAGAGSTPSR